ncbi:MAG: type II CAAX endopeptidase family protein, partial [Myxococcota bacterium]
MRAFGLRKVFGFYLVMAAVAVIAMWRGGDLRTLAPGLDLTAWVTAIGAGLGTGGLMVVISRVTTAHFTWASQLANEFRALLGAISAREALVIALLSGIGEEALFRGTLQPTLGLWLAAVIFAVLHIGPNLRFLPWTIMAFGAGLAFGGLFWWTGNLVAPVLAHITVNYLNLRFLA